MMVYCIINGLRAKALIDSGSTINCISPDFVRISRVSAFSLSHPVGLQLGCVGSRSRINFGVRTKVELDGDSRPIYLDVVNLDHYDVILGTPYMRAVEMVLNFGTNTIEFGGHSVPGLRAEERSVDRQPSGPRSARRQGIASH